MAVPFTGFEDRSATDVKPDFAVVAPKASSGGAVTESWLIMGDAKDYERVRSCVDDARLLKGFLQVALGAESAEAWRELPVGMSVHGHGVLAVPRNAFLQPEALVEPLNDHRAEVRMRVAERRREAGQAKLEGPLKAHVQHLQAAFDPISCTTCTLFSFCRQELRDSADPTDLLVEIGVRPEERQQVVGLVDGSGGGSKASESTMAMVTASVDGVARPTGQRRTDPAGLPGTINVVIAKSDSAALGVYGVGVQRVAADGPGEWSIEVFDDPQGSETRRQIMRILGSEIIAAMKDRNQAKPETPSPVHLVVADGQSADVLASIADNLAGIELSRIRWRHDKAMGRTPLTFNGEEATIPPALNSKMRTGVSFLLEEDRARAFTLRSPIVDIRGVLARHIVAGGPAANSLRLDYLVRWAEATSSEPLDHRAVTDEIEAEIHTPGARLTNRRSNEIHTAFTGPRRTEQRPAEPALYDQLIRDELSYKIDVMDRAIAALDRLVPSRLREVYRAIEGDAQAVWRRRHTLHASDLVRFGRTYRHWRNSLVEVIESDAQCAAQLSALGNPQVALDAARDAGNRDVATAHVLALAPLTLRVDSRRIGAGDRVVLLHVGIRIDVERATVKIQKGGFRFAGMSIGPLTSTGDPHTFVWSPDVDPGLAVGDELVIANFSWFGEQKGNNQLPVDRPKPDTQSAPKVSCDDSSYAGDPESHQYCCRPHEDAEAEWADELAARRNRGELNPQVWPPVVDTDGFEVAPAGAATGDPSDRPAEPVPEEHTIDDLD
ncbi:hypothetical protein [Amycolatopsis sp. NPDC050768]|uniref:hypothetical protein n=1 Tax=Amycolatopsis sp. NPDC050768 TaxID=3154839 RepID=UPI0033D05A6F